MKPSQLLVISALTASLVTGGFLTHPNTAFAAPVATAALPHVVTLQANGVTAQHPTTAVTVGAFLEEEGIVLGAHDYLSPGAQTPLTDGLFIEYRAAVPVTVLADGKRTRVVSAAADVGALLQEQGITLGRDDRVRPSLAVVLRANGVVRVTRIARWTVTRRQRITVPVVHRIVFSLRPGTSRVLARGRAGERLTTVRYTRRDGGAIEKRVISIRVLRRPAARVVAEGIGTYAALLRFEARGLDKTAYIAEQTLHMVATAYTANCAGCSGYTAIGRRAGHGIVAVDPRVIPLGTPLYISGYGFAIAGDTGGAIRGQRIDLGFDSTAAAVQFGRRHVTVYRLK